MNDKRSPDELLREIGRMPISVEDPEVASARRERVVGRVATAIGKNHERNEVRRRFRRTLAWVAAAALFLCALGAALRPRHPAHPTRIASLRTGSAPVMFTRAGKTEIASAESTVEIGVGDGVSTLADSHADLQLASGVEVAVRPSSRVAIERVEIEAEILSLALGEVSVRVPRLGPDRSFMVKTPDARVVVHGTAFVVRVESAGSTTLTHVQVSEGKVSVERDNESAMLEAGDHWPRTAGSPKAKTSEPASGDTPASPGVASAPASASAGTKPAKASDPPSKSALAEQNRLFAAAASARRRGDDRAAVAALSQLITRYPDSVLVPEARVERFRALKRLGRDAEAAKEARKYLVEQRDGPARDEARGLVLEPKR